MTSTATKVRDVEEPHGNTDEYIHYDHIGHGSTPAAWTLSIAVMVGSVFIGAGMVLDVMALIWIGIALMPLAIILGVVLKRMGYGVEIDSKSVLDLGEDPRAHVGPATEDLSESPTSAPKPPAA